MKYSIEDAISKMRHKQAAFKREATKEKALSVKEDQFLKSSNRFGQIAEWLTGYKKIRESVPVDELRGIVHNLENYDPGLFDIRITEQDRDNIVKVLKAVLEG